MQNSWIKRVACLRHDCLRALFKSLFFSSHLPIFSLLRLLFFVVGIGGSIFAEINDRILILVLVIEICSRTKFFDTPGQVDISADNFQLDFSMTPLMPLAGSIPYRKLPSHSFDIRVFLIDSHPCKEFYKIVGIYPLSISANFGCIISVVQFTCRRPEAGCFPANFQSQFFFCIHEVVATEIGHQYWHFHYN